MIAGHDTQDCKTCSLVITLMGINVCRLYVEWKNKCPSTKKGNPIFKATKPAADCRQSSFLIDIFMRLTVSSTSEQHLEHNSRMGVTFNPTLLDTSI